MIVGSGLLARAFKPEFGANPEIIIFASGVSNSLETRAEEFSREHSLLCELLEGAAKRLVYFGSCGVVTTGQESTPYMEHKKLMESLVLASPGSLVLRLPQVVGATNNPHTLTNFIRDRILTGEHFTVWEHAERNLVDVDDVAAIGSQLIKSTSLARTISVPIAAERSLPMPEIVSMFERALRKTANYSIAPKGLPLPVDATEAVQIGAKLGINLGQDYIESVIRKYYSAN
jgi:nucleoside-diphosphate-sugar epimerase